MKMNPVGNRTINAALRDAAIIRYGEQHGAALVSIDKETNDVVKRAIALRRMERTAKLRGFLALPIDQYLARVAHSAEVELDTILSAPQGSDSAAHLNPWIALAGRLQLTSEHIRLWVRVWFAKEFQAPAPTTFVMARHAARIKSGEGSWSPLSVEVAASPERVEAELERLESRYDLSYRVELEQALRMIL